MTLVLTNNLLDNPYIFGSVQPQDDDVFTVPDDWELQIEGGAEIQFNAGVSLVVEGLIEQLDDDAEVLITRIPEAGAWGTIRIIGDGVFGRGNGFVSLLRVGIDGGGAGNDWENDGLITMRGFHPELIIGLPDGETCFLRDSESNGIALYKDVDQEHEFF